MADSASRRKAQSRLRQARARRERLDTLSAGGTGATIEVGPWAKDHDAASATAGMEVLLPSRTPGTEAAIDNVHIRAGYVISSGGRTAPLQVLAGPGKEPQRHFRLHLAALAVANETARRRENFTNKPDEIPFVGAGGACWASLSGVNVAATGERAAKRQMRDAVKILERHQLLTVPRTRRSGSRRRGDSAYERFTLMREDAVSTPAGLVRWSRPRAGTSAVENTPGPRTAFLVPADFWRYGWYLLLERREILALFALLAHSAETVITSSAAGPRGIAIPESFRETLGLTHRYDAFNWLERLGIIDVTESEVTPLGYRPKAQGGHQPNPTLQPRARRMRLQPNCFSRPALPVMQYRLQQYETDLETKIESTNG